MDGKLDGGILQSFQDIMEYLPIFFEDDISFALADREKYLAVRNCKEIPINAKPGDRISQVGVAAEALKYGKITVKDVAKEELGVPFKSYAAPIFDSKRNIVGVILANKNLQRRTEIASLSENFSTSLKQISKAIENINSSVQDVLNSNADIESEVNVAKEGTKGTDEIIKFIQGISTQTNMLGLNAAIESARAGELGKGFGVVAQEIRKLAGSSSESIKKIEGILKNIEDSVTNIAEKVNITSASIENQASALEEINSSIEELTSVAQILEKLSKKI